MSASSTDSACGRIIIIDKEICLRQMLEQVLTDPFQVVTAISAEDGLTLIEMEGAFDIIISSFSLPGMNGLEFLRQVGVKHPETVRILMTGGNANLCDLNRAISEGHITSFICKPFSLVTLRNQLKADLASVRATSVKSSRCGV